MTADRDQVFLLPPDVREWLPEDHLAWTVLDAVAELDLDGFRRRYRADGYGRPAYDPVLMVGLLLFAYCDGVRSSRQIEVRCERDVAYRVVAGNQVPDHATIARFRTRHRAELADLFVQVLRLCAVAGMVKVGLVAIDGTKMAGNASTRRTRSGEQITAEVKRLLDEAQAVDAAEDAAHGDQRGDEPPPGLRGRGRRLRRLREAKARLDAEAEAAQQAQDERRTRWEQARAKGGKVGGPPGQKPPKSKQPSSVINTTDGDSRVMKKADGGFCQGYNGQIVTTSGQVIVAADIICTSPDNTALHPMLDQTRDNLDAAGITDRVRGVVADSGYGGETNLSTDRRGYCDPILLVGVDTGRHTKHTKDFKHPALQAMAKRLQTPAGKRLYRRRAWMVEPVFGQTKNRLGARLHYRGHANVTAEWNLIATSHNLLKLCRHTLQPAT